MVIAALSIELWASCEAYTRSRGTSARPAIPSADACSPIASRAAARLISEDVEAVSVRSPSNVVGSPRASRSQPTTTPSSSVPAGEVRHSIGFWPRVAVSISPRIPGPDAVVPK